MSATTYGIEPYGYDSAISSDIGSINSMEGSVTWIIIAAVIAVIGALILYFTFLSKRNDGKFKGFLGWTYEF